MLLCMAGEDMVTVLVGGTNDNDPTVFHIVV